MCSRPLLPYTSFKLVQDQCEDQGRHVLAFSTYLVIHQMDPNSIDPNVGFQHWLNPDGSPFG
jgi:hypothetical protein